MIKLDLTSSNILDKDIETYQNKVSEIHTNIHNRTSLGKEFLGWIELPNNYNKAEYSEMKKFAQKMSNKIDVLVVIGIGGSYLGAYAGITMINGLLPTNKVKVIFAGNTMSSTYTQQVLNYLKNKKFGICVISKSGTTTEPAIAFRLISELLIQQVGKTDSKDLIAVITDSAKGALKKLATEEGYQTFVIPNDIGGRYSVLTPVGLFPMMVAGIDTDQIIDGAKLAYNDLKTNYLSSNDAYKYAVARYILNSKFNYKMELLVSYELQLQLFGEWWKQLFGESEGKDGKGIFPGSCIFSTDLHSLGQFIQEGTRNLFFETLINIKKPNLDLRIPLLNDDSDGINYLVSKSLHEINETAVKGVLQAHTNGNVPNLILNFQQMDAKMFGYASYWFMKACAMSAYLLGVNPFNQPGVEIYKTNMFKLLHKPGY